ncbi:putative DNA binding domain-containing protein [Chitinophaga oryzae]|uniref:DNA binding domain-containing protein n=1 Tax=Chitinophaga oryzae TaxID=2725414 RepID=A0AAE7D7I0_9BACT|nr:ATP-binding protein [Chitinophaga oryzae]QJB32266.1 putative DNA binding domain-containing protein [Chitinophaga oryzae]
MPEQQNIEYKTSWRDEHLKWICGFANAQGGRIFIGLDDTGAVVGVEDYRKLMDEIPNKTVNHLGLVVDVNLREREQHYYIEIIVPVSTVPIAYHGVYHYRSGSTKQELKGIALQNLLLKKIGKKWEELPVEGATLEDFDRETIDAFLQKARVKERIPADAVTLDTMSLLQKLELATPSGEFSHAALLLFGKSLGRVSITASFKIGRFGKSNHDLLFHDMIETNIFSMADSVLELLKRKYLIRPISYEGLQRLEPLEYPEMALREAICNAIIHRDYASTYTFLRVFDDRLHIWNPGNLPEELKVEALKENHSSYPRNRNIANVFYKAGYIESWGRGINKIVEACVEAGLPEPRMVEEQGGFSIVFYKDAYSLENLRKFNLEERQIKALLFIKEHGQISNKQYQGYFSVSKRTATSDLQILLLKQLIEKVGSTGRGTFYILSKPNGAINTPKGAIKGQNRR